MSLYSRETEETAARRFKQLLPLLYMRPQVQGSYVFCYSGQLPKHNSLVAEYTWGLCRPDRSRRPAFYSVKQLYSDFKQLDCILGSFYTVQLVAITNQLVDELTEQVYDSDKIARVLYALGVPIRFVRSDKFKEISNLDIDRLIVNDLCLYSSPTGVDDELQALQQYIEKPKNRALTFNRRSFTKLYGEPCELSGIERAIVDKNSPCDVWQELAPFIHGDFVKGIASGGNGADTLRILDAYTSEPRLIWQVQQQLLYTHDSAILAVVNTGEEAIEELCITLGTTLDNGFTAKPFVICADGGVSVRLKADADVPGWVGEECKLRFYTVTLKNLDTYAFIKL